MFYYQADVRRVDAFFYPKLIIPKLLTFLLTTLTTEEIFSRGNIIGMLTTGCHVKVQMEGICGKIYASPPYVHVKMTYKE